ncbi:MAG: ribosome silencing factor [Phycisphaerales bacterium]|nr:ribosome silencing factor [Phycisphaerales bacterium]
MPTQDDDRPNADRDHSLKVSRAAAGERAEREREAHDFAIAAARSLSDDKCEDVLLLDLRGRSQVTDFYIIASGTSERQMRGAAHGVSEIGGETGFDLLSHNMRERDATWIVLDFVDVVVHLFHPEQRMHYDLEMLWGDAPRVEWRRPGQAGEGRERTPSRNRAGLTDDDVLSD